MQIEEIKARCEDRITARNGKGLAYLVKVKPDEQDVESSYPNTLRCIMECFNRLAEFEESVPALIAELDSTKAKLDAAIKDMTSICHDNIHCDYCKNLFECKKLFVNRCENFEWRGIEENGGKA